MRGTTIAKVRECSEDDVREAKGLLRRVLRDNKYHPGANICLARVLAEEGGMCISSKDYGIGGVGQFLKTSLVFPFFSISFSCYIDFVFFCLLFCSFRFHILSFLLFMSFCLGDYCFLILSFCIQTAFLEPKCGLMYRNAHSSFLKNNIETHYLIVMGDGFGQNRQPLFLKSEGRGFENSIP